MTVDNGGAIKVGTVNPNNATLTAAEFAGNSASGINSTPPDASKPGPFYIARTAYAYDNSSTASSRGYKSNGSNLPMKTGVYHQIHHQVYISGGMTNNGTVRFHNLDTLNFDQISGSNGLTSATSGAATVYFQGTADDTLTLNGTTDFYNLVVDKGTDPTYSLTVNPSGFTRTSAYGGQIALARITVRLVRLTPIRLCGKHFGSIMGPLN